MSDAAVRERSALCVLSLLTTLHLTSLRALVTHLPVSVGCLVFVSIALAVVIITFLAASLIEVFENDRERFPRHVSLARQETSLTFLDCQYFVLVTIATIG